MLNSTGAIATSSIQSNFAPLLGGGAIFMYSDVNVSFGIQSIEKLLGRGGIYVFLTHYQSTLVIMLATIWYKFRLLPLQQCRWETLISYMAIILRVLIVIVKSQMVTTL